MSGKKPDKSRYWLTYLLDNLPVGATFKPDALHLSILVWFVTDMDEKEVIDSFNDTFSGTSAFTVNVGRMDEFKSRHKVVINHLAPEKEIVSLHLKALDWFSYLGARWALEYPRVKDEFIPHVRRRQGRNLQEGDKLSISSLSLVKANRRGDDYREVIAKMEFDEKA